jgi:uncharacterized membrane protein YqiK
MGIGVAVLLVLFTIIGFVVARLYRKATKETAFVRTGMGGEKVIKDGGAVIISALHEIIFVNMKTLRLVVRRDREQALITADKLRVDVEAEFHVRVKQDADAISRAAQTLGDKTMNPEKLREQVESKFVDALRSVAAGMEMNELHENRADFVQKVQNAINEDLDKNGLELEAVSLTALDQTDFQYFNENNAFDAEGLKKLKEITERRRKERNEIERDTQVAIETKDLEARKKSLDIKRDEDFATAEQKREIAEKESEETKVSELARIEAERATREAEIAKERSIKEREIEREKIIEAAQIEKTQVIESTEISKRKTLEIAEQNRAIEVAKKSEEQSKAKAAAEKERAEAVAAEQEVFTAEAVAIANREKDIAIIAEKTEAERKATKILVEAEAERRAAEDKSAAKRTVADAEAYEIIQKAEADAKKFATEAEGKEKINAAADKLPQAERELQTKMALISNMAAIIAAAVKPIESIDSFRILDMRGSPTSMTGLVTDEEGKPTININGGKGGSDNLPAQVVDSLMKYRTQMPILEKLLDEVGIDLSEGLSGLTKSIDIDTSSGVKSTED